MGPKRAGAYDERRRDDITIALDAAETHGEMRDAAANAMIYLRDAVCELYAIDNSTHKTIAGEAGQRWIKVPLFRGCASPVRGDAQSAWLRAFAARVIRFTVLDAGPHGFKWRETLRQLNATRPPPGFFHGVTGGWLSRGAGLRRFRTRF